MTNERKPSFGIVTDTTADLPEHILEENNIDVIPVLLNFGEKSFRDKVDININEFLNMIQDENNPHPKTAAPPLGDYFEVYNRHEGEVVSIHVGSGFSGVFSNAESAARELPKDKIHTYDSETTTLGLGFMVMEAALLSQEGQSKEEIFRRLDDMKERTSVYGLFDSAEYLRKSGRVSWGKAKLASKLSIKPMLQVDRNDVRSVGTVRTRKKAFNKLMNLARDHHPLEKVGIMQAGAEADAEIAGNIISEFHKGEIMSVDLTASLAVHGGPNLLAIALLEEKK